MKFKLYLLTVAHLINLCFSMEKFPESCGRLLREFETLLNHSPSPINCTRIIQMMAINMFAIDNTEPKGEFYNFKYNSFACTLLALNN